MLVEPLARRHDRSRFDCGDEAINEFLREKAMQDQRLNLSRTMVLVDDARDRDRVIGFHTLIATLVVQSDIPSDHPRITRQIPVVLLGQLGIDNEYQRMRLGDRLLIDIQARFIDISQTIAFRALMLDARTPEVAGWYERHQFRRFPGSLRMFKDINTIRKLFETGG